MCIIVHSCMINFPKNIRVFISRHFKHSPRPFIHSRERVIYEKIFTGEVKRKFNDACSARKNRGRLSIVFKRSADACVRVDRIKYFSNNMERRNQVHSSIADIHANLVADLCLHSRGCFYSAIESHIVWMTQKKRVGIKYNKPFFTKLSHSVKFALHEIKFFFDFGKSFFWINQNHTVLPMRVMG